MTLKYLIQKEFIQIKRNAFMPKLIIIYPMIIMCIMPWVMDMEQKNIIVSIVDNDHSEISQQLVHRIEASKYFIFNGVKPSYSEAMNDIEDCKTDIVAVIPHGFGSDMVCGRNTKILIAANAVNGTKGGIGSNYLSQIILSHIQTTNNVAQDIVSQLYLYNKHLNYKVFMIPALMCIMLMMICGFLPALNIVSEKETGTIEQINVTPVSKWIFILSKLIPYWIIGFVVISICFILSWLIYGITSQGNLMYIILISSLMTLTFSSLGLIISNYSDTMQQAIFVMWFIVMCFILLSGLFTPVRSMPEWTQSITKINPMRYYIDAMRTVFIRGGELESIMKQVVALCCFSVVLGCLAVFSYKKNH